MKKTKKHYPIDLGGLISFQKQTYLIARHLVRPGIVKLGISAAGQPIGVRCTALPMIWARVACLDIPARIAHLKQLIADRLAEAAWWDRLEQGDPIALQEYARRYCPDGKGGTFLDPCQAQFPPGVFRRPAAECRQKADAHQQHVMSLQSLSGPRILLVQSWHRSPCRARATSKPGLSFEVLKIPTHPDYDDDPEYDP